MTEKTNKPRLRLELTPEQQEEIRKLTGKEVPAVELTVETLEERVAPGFAHGDLQRP